MICTANVPTILANLSDLGSEKIFFNLPRCVWVNMITPKMMVQIRLPHLVQQFWARPILVLLKQEIWIVSHQHIGDNSSMETIIPLTCWWICSQCQKWVEFDTKLAFREISQRQTRVGAKTSSKHNSKHPAAAWRVAPACWYPPIQS